MLEPWHFSIATSSLGICPWLLRPQRHRLQPACFVFFLCPSTASRRPCRFGACCNNCRMASYFSSSASLSSLPPMRLAPLSTSPDPHFRLPEQPPALSLRLRRRRGKEALDRKGEEGEAGPRRAEGKDAVRLLRAMILMHVSPYFYISVQSTQSIFI